MKKVFVILLIIAASIGAWYKFKYFYNKEKLTSIPKTLAVATELTPAKPVINFSLLDTEGKTFTQDSLLGNWTLLFFGYAQCPDICPRTLATIAQTWQLLSPQTKIDKSLHFVFVSLDPESDSSESLRTFLKRFNPSFVGLTGEENAIQSLSKACNVFSWQDPNTNPNGPKVIDHSATLLLINPQGKIQALFSPPHDKTALVKDIEHIVSR